MGSKSFFKYLSLIIWFMSISAFAKEISLTCSGDESHESFSFKTGMIKHQTKVNRKFSILIDEDNNSLKISDGNFAMCYLTEFNRNQSIIEEIETKTSFQDQGVFYYCHSQSMSDGNHLSVKYEGTFTIKRLSGDMKSENLGIEEKSGKLLNKSKGQFSCSVLEKKF